MDVLLGFLVFAAIVIVCLGFGIAVAEIVRRLFDR